MTSVSLVSKIGYKKHPAAQSVEKTLNITNTMIKNTKCNKKSTHCRILLKTLEMIHMMMTQMRNWITSARIVIRLNMKTRY